MSRGIFDGRRNGGTKLGIIVFAIILGVIGYNVFNANHPVIGAVLILLAIGTVLAG